MLQTICGTGIRISELEYITVDAVRRGEAVIQLKGKTRRILIAGKLKKLLCRYLQKEKLVEGPVFVTKNGYGRLVVMDIDYYDRTMKEMEEAKLIMEGLRDVEQGRTVDGETFMKELGAKYGL